ncbi:MAG: hypothetical protein WC975_00115 [Phycisphaerae bacterium]
MQYQGKYKIFDSHRIRTYPISTRTNKVKLENLVDPKRVLIAKYDVGEQQASTLKDLARIMVSTAHAGKPVIWFTGAHLVKNGLGPLVVDLVHRGMISLLATNGAGVIHDFELALIGETSEYVPNALPEGRFGMATELGYINAALIEGQERHLGYGEALGRFICDDEFRSAVENRMGVEKPIKFTHPEVSIIAAAYQCNIPLTVHVGIGTDVTDQHPNFDGSAKGGCSGRDFLIFTREVARLQNGGVVLNIGSAVTGPEVLLKAISMAGNTGQPACGIITADFDLKPFDSGAMKDDGSVNYYFRHHKSVVTRVPEACGGKGFYIQGDQKNTIPYLYQEVIKIIQ